MLCPWILSKLAEVFGPDAPVAIIDIIKSRPTISILPVDIIANILNYTNLKDTLNTMMVCKKWYKASRLERFWRERILKGFKKHTKSVQEYEVLKTHFDVFLIKEQPFKTKLEWLFFSDSAQVGRGDNVFKNYNLYLRISLWDVESYELIITFNTITKEKMTKYNVICKNNTGKWVKSGLDVCYIDNSLPLKYIKRIHPSKQCDIEWVSTDGHIFKGDGLCFNDTVQPHGGGKWTFLDGTTLTGSNVAFAGHPHGVGAADEDKYFAGKKVNRNKKQKI